MSRNRNAKDIAADLDIRYALALRLIREISNQHGEKIPYVVLKQKVLEKLKEHKKS